MYHEYSYDSREGEIISNGIKMTSCSSKKADFRFLIKCIHFHPRGAHKFQSSYIESPLFCFTLYTQICCQITFSFLLLSISWPWPCHRRSFPQILSHLSWTYQLLTIQSQAPVGLEDFSRIGQGEISSRRAKIWRIWGWHYEKTLCWHMC